MGEILTTKEVAERLKMSERTVYTHLHNGDLEAAKIGQEWRVREEDLEKFIEERKPAKQKNE